MSKKKYQDKQAEQWIKNILQQIRNNFERTGNFDPYSAKMPDTFVKFESIFGNKIENFNIYRFFKFHKFENLVNERKLTYISPLIYDDDEKEAECFDKYKIFIYKHLKMLYEKDMLIFENTGIKKTNEKEIDLASIASRWEKIFQFCRRNVFVSCWTLNKPDNKYMWKEYTSNEADAVVIKTSVDSLIKSLSKVGLGCHYIDKIRYIDWENQTVDTNDKIHIKTLDALRYQLFHKQEKFKEDNEFRILIDNLTCYSTPWDIENTNTILGHKDFDYDQYFDDRPNKFLKENIVLEDLIEEVILSPFHTEADYEKIRQFLNDNNLQNVKLIRN